MTAALGRPLNLQTVLKITTRRIHNDLLPKLENRTPCRQTIPKNLYLPLSGLFNSDYLLSICDGILIVFIFLWSVFTVTNFEGTKWFILLQILALSRFRKISQHFRPKGERLIAGVTRTLQSC